MSSNSISRPSQGAPPLVVLAAWLENAHHRDDRVISFPANTSEAFRQARSSGTQYDMQEVQAIVLTLEERNSNICERLDSLSLTILCSIFIYSQECLAQQRGLCLLAKALHRDEGDSAQEGARKQGKKTALGQAALTLLIKGFLKTDASNKLRRWLGILALELLENCPKNTEKLQSDPHKDKYWQHLREVIEHGSCQVLKLLAGSMIRELLSFGVSPDDFWPSEADLDLYSKFPKSQHHNSQWVTSFEEFVEDLVLGKIVAQEVSNVVFAQAVHVGDRKWDLREASDILTTVSEEINIIVPAKDANPAVYIDVSLDSILEVSLDKAFVTDSQHLTYGLIIQLMVGTTTNCILNATEYAGRHVALAFASEKDANTLRRLLMPTSVRANGFPPHSQSGAIDGSEPILPDDELAAPGSALSHRQNLMRTASLASAMIPHKAAASTSNPLSLKLVHTLQRASAEHQKWSSRSMIEHDEDSQRVGHNVEMAEEGIDVSYNGSLVEQAIEGIDVSQNDGLNHEEIQYRDAQAHVPDNASSNARIRHSQVPSNGALAPLGNSDQNSSTGLSSSLRWRTNPNTTKNAPELRTPQQAVSYVEPVENKIRPISQDPEHDDLFDASPKVKDGQRKSPRIIARDNVPKQLDRSLEPNTREAGDKTGPPAKLSRQLRNANGVVGSRTLQTADDNLTTPTKIGAGVVKISANSKNGKSSVYTKLRTVAESTKSTKKTAQTRGQAFATEESPTASHNIYDFSPSPTRVDSIIQTSVKKKEATTTRPKATKAARNNRKQAKPVPTKATATTSSKGPAAQPEKGTKDKARANGMTQDSIPSRSNGKRADDDDDAIWDVDQTHSEEKTRDPRQSRQPAKTAKKQEVPIPKTKKKKVQTQPHSDEAKANKATKTTKAQTQAPTARVMQLKPAPAALSQLRPRRAAAIKANKKIQGLYESDEIVDDEEVTPALTRSSPHASSDAVKALRIQKVRNGGDKRATSSGKLPTARILAKDSISDSVSPDYSDEQRVDSVSNPKDDNSPEKVDLVRDPSAEALPAAPGDTRDSSTKENLTSLAETPMIPLHSGHGDRSIQPNPTSAEKVAEVNEARVNLMSGSVPQLYESITETELAPPRPQENNYAEQGDLDATKQAGPGDQDQVEHVLPYLYDVSLELNSKPDRVQEEVGPPQAPTAPVLVELRQRRAPPRLAEAPPKPLPESTATKRDPFGAKLNALMPELKDTNAKFKSREGDAHVESKGSSATKPAELARSSRVPEAGAFENLEATSLEEAKQVENPPRYLKSAMQVDGEGRDSRFQTLKPARESISASSGENKRRTEQTGKISIKRVKLAPQDRLEGASARRELTYDTKETPPPVVSKRPLVIGFSKTGPRNQGSVSTKNPKPPKDVGNGAPGAVKLRQHDVPIPMTFQVEAGFAPVPETLEKSSEDIQDNAKNADGAQKEIRGSPQRKQAEHLTIVNAVAAREANAQEHRAQKRKLAPAPDEPAPWEHEQLSKRQKRDIETPPTVQNHHPKLLPDISPALVHDRSQRVSSQNTRVNENGSPMPFVVTHGEKIAAEEQYSDEDDGKNALAEARLEEQIVLQDDGPILPEPMLPLRPLVPTDSISQLKTTTYECLSNNSKQLPSSPHAPSVFGTMPPHHIYHDGEIVNVETNESIIPVNPQDPFLGATENPRNSFMIALRKSTENAAKRLISGANDRRGSGGVFVRPSLNVGEDPDKTLVAPSLRKKYKQDHVLESSSSSASGSSLRASQPDESSEEEIDEETETKWRKGLEPHQENMLECLLTISHRLIRHLVDKETAIKDMVTDFANRGNNFVDGYEHGLQDYIDYCRANIDRRHQDLVKIFEKAQEDRAMTSRAVAKRRVQDMKTQWETQQEALKGKMAAALAACAGDAE